MFGIWFFDILGGFLCIFVWRWLDSSAWFQYGNDNSLVNTSNVDDLNTTST